ncbi:TetR/AcrR family transcriptional regulator [Croceicoccus ponticola]|uniref:TetR/AcrR family transcriptional regulator n=2 Tax=Croceicoccus ponticola TaxID=2217664 RepID=A0A437GUF0_9SPHN|nr:TetR/AcrR family transcriptional regulator [Croceicoccus ponticola]
MPGDIVTKPTSGIGARRSANRDEETRPAKYDAKRQSIVEAAGKVFNREGFERASMSAVAREIGVDRATLYYYFSSKEDLFDDVVGSIVEKNLKMCTAIRDSKLKPARKLRDLMVQLMQSYDEHYPFFYIYIRENLSHVSDKRTAWSKRMRQLNQQTTDAVIDIVEQGLADGTLRKVGSPRVIAYGLFGIVGWTHRWYRPGNCEVSATEIGSTYAEIFIAGLENQY